MLLLNCTKFLCHQDKIHIDDKFLEEIEYQLNHLILDQIFQMKHFHQTPLFHQYLHGPKSGVMEV